MYYKETAVNSSQVHIDFQRPQFRSPYKEEPRTDCGNRARMWSPSLRLPQGSSLNLLSIISKFEALDALSLPFKGNFEEKLRDLKNDRANRIGDETKPQSLYSNLRRTDDIEIQRLQNNEVAAFQKRSDLSPRRWPDSNALESSEGCLQRSPKLPSKSSLSSLRIYRNSEAMIKVPDTGARKLPQQTLVRDMISLFDGSKDL